MGRILPAAGLRAAVSRLLGATGYCRIAILLAPVTARIMHDCVAEGRGVLRVSALLPDRLARRR